MRICVERVSSGLGETGYVEGRNVAIEYRWAEGQYDRLPAHGGRTGSPTQVIDRRRRRRYRPRRQGGDHTIPIVFVIGGDPVQPASSQASTGRAAMSPAVTLLTAELAAKRLELCSEMIPRSTVALFVNPSNPMPRPQL